MTDWRREVEESLYLQKLLPLHSEEALEKELLEKKPLRSLPLRELPVSGAHSPGEIKALSDGFLLRFPLRQERWPDDGPQDGDYTNFGKADAWFRCDSKAWQGMNRLRFRVLPEFSGTEVVTLNVGVQCEETDAYGREGETTFNLNNHQWNECCYEFPELAASCVHGIRFYVLLCGQNTGMARQAELRFAQVRLEQIEAPEPYEGWQCRGLTLPSAGYWPKGQKIAIAPASPEESFAVLDAQGRTVWTGTARRMENGKGRFSLLDLTPLTALGEYRLVYGGLTADFAIRDDLAAESLWKTLNFVYGERCGCGVPDRHCACHLDTVAEHEGRKIVYAGGWHDAGDVSQQTLQTGEMVQALLEAANAAEKQKETMLAERLRLEAAWGLDFLLRTRFGDGFRATSAGATRWTDNQQGTMDDVAVRVHDQPFENLLFSGIEAFSAQALRQSHRALSESALAAAEEDFAVGLNAYRERGVCRPNMFEHSYSSGPSLYAAALVWSAAQIYQASGKAEYLPPLREYAAYLLRCQEQDGPLPGPFYRDESHGMLMHFNHQCREHLYAEAMAAALRADAEMPNRQAVEDALRRYAGYLKAIAPYAAPYGMLPAGVYRLGEEENREVFELSHLLVSHEQERENYRAQLEQGAPLAEGRVVRLFPVWFSFRGNNTVLLSQGRAAAVAGLYLGDEELMNLAREQCYWVWGKNPFRQSLQYGMGSRYPSQYAVFPGELTGSLPVGIETRGDRDEPFWPQANNATYKEVWIAAAARWTSLLAALMEEPSC